VYSHLREGVVMDASISPTSLITARSSADAPLVIDVRRRPAFSDATDTVAGALRRDPEAIAGWAAELPSNSCVVVYCVHGHRVSQDAAQVLRDRGLNARYLDHGIEGWREAGGAVQLKPQGASTRWVTRERPKIDRIACPWLIARFIDRDAEFLYVPTVDVPAIASAQAAIPYDTAGAEFGHVGEACSFDAFVRRYGLVSDPALRRLAAIVRGADTGHLTLTPESPGLLAVSTGLSRMHQDDATMLGHGMHVYDALYRWCQEDQPESTTWRLLARQ